MKVLIMGSGPTARQIDLYPYKENGWTVVAVNNAHVAYDGWDYWIRSVDFRGLNAKFTRPEQQLINDYNTSVKKFGGQKVCGYSTILSASYTVLDLLKPELIGYLGCDMNYTPNEKGETHVYGVGFDIKKHGISDPDRMVKEWGKDDPNYLTNIYLRFEVIAKENGCKVVNLSRDIETRLPYERMKVENNIG